MSEGTGQVCWQHTRGYGVNGGRNLIYFYFCYEKEEKNVVLSNLTCVKPLIELKGGFLTAS